jgi:ribosome biogenesis GTPase A
MVFRSRLLSLSLGLGLGLGLVMPLALSLTSLRSCGGVTAHRLHSSLFRLSATTSSSSASASSASPLSSPPMIDADEPNPYIVLDDGNRGPHISWYPGHIAKAERELAEYLKKVDVVIEVRDARIPLSTTHPKVPEWVGSKPLIIAIARLDQVSPKALSDWREYYAMNPAHKERPDAKVFFIDGKVGAGVLPLRKEALKASIGINEKRVKRGIEPRAVRAAVIGFPNVGKSALINRLLGKTMARSRNLPGVTRSMQWVRLGGIEGSQENVIELLDSPGIIPATQLTQQSALALAICNDIGEASYDRVVVAAAMCERVISLHKTHRTYVDMRRIKLRYELPFDEMTGEEIVYTVADKFYHGNQISAADRLLGDFRKNLMGYGSLEATPKKSKTEGAEGGRKEGESRSLVSEKESSKEEMGEKKVEAGVVRGLDVGRGDYEGW